jgi:hypothetical protein
MIREQLTTRKPCFVYFAAIALVTMFLISTCASQKTEAAQPEDPFSQAMSRYPGLVPELGVLFDKLKQNVQFPESRRQSKLLPLLPPATTYYIAVPNYGEPARQALATFREELKQSQALREWWQSGDVAKTGTQIEDYVDKSLRSRNTWAERLLCRGRLGGRRTVR